MSVIWQNGESIIGCFKKTKHAKFCEKRTFLTLWYAHVLVRIRRWEIFVFRKIWRALFCFWNTRFKIRHFAILPTIWPDFSESPEIVRKLCLSTKFSRLEIRWNYGILPSVYVFIPNMETFWLEKTSHLVLFVIY